VLLESISRLSKSLPPEIRLRDVKIGDALAKPGARNRNDDEKMRAAFTRAAAASSSAKSNPPATRAPHRGAGRSLPRRGHRRRHQAGVIKWPSYAREILLTGEIEENIRDGPRRRSISCGTSSRTRRARQGGDPEPEGVGQARLAQFELVISFE